MTRPSSFRIRHCQRDYCHLCAMERPLSRTERRSLAAIVLLSFAIGVAFAAAFEWESRLSDSQAVSRDVHGGTVGSVLRDFRTDGDWGVGAAFGVSDTDASPGAISDRVW